MAVGFLFLVCLFLFLAFTAREGDAATIIVAQDGSGNCTTIQEAIDNATEGDTIRVWEGTYNEKVVVDRTVSIIGNGSKVTIIDSGGESDVVNLTADWVNLSGFQVSGSGAFNAGIRIESNYNNITGNTLIGNKYGIFLYHSNFNRISNITCINNDKADISLSYHKDNNFTSNKCNLQPIAHARQQSRSTSSDSHTVVKEQGYGEDIDGIIMAYEWSYNGQIISTQSNITIADRNPKSNENWVPDLVLDYGFSYLEFRVRDNQSVWSEPYNVSVYIRPPVEGPDPTTAELDMSRLLIGVSVVILIFMSIAVLIFQHNK